MAALTAILPTKAGVVATGTTPTASDTIAASIIGSRGAYLRVATAGTASNITIADPGTTQVGNAGTAVAVALSATQVKVIYIGPGHVNPATGVATVTSSSQTGATYELYPI